MITLLDSLKELSFILILISTMVYRRHLKLTRWKRKLTMGEWIMYIVTSTALPVYAVLYMVFLLGT
ncbi:hypothetical protein ACE1MS_09345 [Lysinibacillus sp. fkY74-1]|uniref:Uncharacterized protein n=2 Tax=Lysinibacillus TaxID=400634 RepID=W7RR60_LYSSH|nr:MULTISPECIES: hypothetical protein [Lysinibacillus]EWH34117.1 hypothetical protein P799_08010 [Lysinibacillus sphaericus CBAM5]MCS1394613.1 hypothetical protein [Lysinibacillus sp. PB211]MDM5350152.1 hypothetical protein [Lysinibacillus sphaericus]MDR0157450.1 hypothetical protein [Lysinibacillus sphaericus]